MKFVYIRGLVREKRHWDRFVPFMKKHFPNDDHFSVDIKGVGERYQVRSSSTISGMAEDIKEQLEKKYGDTLAGDLNLISVSMGGMIAIQFAYQFPDLVNSLVLMNTSIKGVNSIRLRLKPYGMINFFKVMFAFTTEKREDIILNMVSNNTLTREEIRPTWIKIQKENPVSKLNSFLQTFAAFRFSYPGVKIPAEKMLFLAGKGDNLCDYRCSEQLNKLFKGSSLSIHETAGHNIIDDDSEWVSQEITNFLN